MILNMYSSFINTLKFSSDLGKFFAKTILYCLAKVDETDKRKSII